MKACHYCATTDADLRPYGPGGSWVCFPCAMATPEREQECMGRFGAQLDAAAAISPTGVAIIDAREPSAAGPQPLLPDHGGEQ